MRIGGAMAAGAVSAEFLVFQGSGMTSLAGHSGVRAGELELRMLEGRHGPLIVAVAGAAGHAQTAFMPIVSLVTTRAVLGYRCVQVAATVAVCASNVCVAPGKRETRLAGVIELLRAPVGRRVAVAAVLT